MTLFGKVLVFINLALSMAMAVMAMAFYTNRIDWSNAPARDGKPAGELLALQKELRELWNKIPPVAVSWRASRAALLKAEQGTAPDGSGSRTADRQWYEQELEHLRSGATAANPAHQVVFNQGLVVLDPNNNNRPQVVPAKDKFGNPLRSMTSYFNDEKMLLAQLEKEDKRLQDGIVEDTRLTERLVLPPGVPGPKGLRQRILDEQDKLAKVMEEHKIIKPLLINAVVDSELILKRRDLLESRLKELQKEAEAGVGVAARD